MIVRAHVRRSRDPGARPTSRKKASFLKTENGVGEGVDEWIGDLILVRKSSVTNCFLIIFLTKIENPNMAQCTLPINHTVNQCCRSGDYVSNKFQ